MRFNEVYNTLQKLIKTEINQAELGRVLGVSRANINYKKQANTLISDEDVKKIETYYNISILKQSLAEKLMEGASFSAAAKIPDVVEIPYWEGLPDDLKHPEYTCVMAQRISIEHGWELKPENLCIVAMNGDAMENYWYKIRNNDVLIIDTSETKINANGSGVYFATSRNNSMFWIREMQMLYNGDVEIHSYSPSGAKTKVLTQEQLKEADFKVIGKVIKNVSFRL